MVMLKPMFEVDVANPEIFKPERVVVPKPIEETESCVAVDEPTTNPIESPAIGLTERRANGEDEEIPTLAFKFAIKAFGSNQNFAVEVAEPPKVTISVILLE